MAESVRQESLITTKKNNSSRAGRSNVMKAYGMTEPQHIYPDQDQLKSIRGRMPTLSSYVQSKKRRGSRASKVLWAISVTTEVVLRQDIALSYYSTRSAHHSRWECRNIRARARV